MIISRTVLASVICGIVSLFLWVPFSAIAVSSWFLAIMLPGVLSLVLNKDTFKMFSGSSEFSNEYTYGTAAYAIKQIEVERNQKDAEKRSLEKGKAVQQKGLALLKKFLPTAMRFTVIVPSKAAARFVLPKRYGGDALFETIATWNFLACFLLTIATGYVAKYIPVLKTQLELLSTYGFPLACGLLYAFGQGRIDRSEAERVSNDNSQNSETPKSNQNFALRMPDGRIFENVSFERISQAIANGELDPEGTYATRQGAEGVGEALILGSGCSIGCVGDHFIRQSS